MLKTMPHKQLQNINIIGLLGCPSGTLTNGMLLDLCGDGSSKALVTRLSPLKPSELSELKHDSPSGLSFMNFETWNALRSLWRMPDIPCSRDWGITFEATSTSQLCEGCHSSLQGLLRRGHSNTVLQYHQLAALKVLS